MEQGGPKGNLYSLTDSVPVRPVSLRGPRGERRLPVDIVREDLLLLSANTWEVFEGDELGNPPAYASDLLRRLVPLKRQWIGQIGPSFLQNATLVELAGQSGCCGLLLDGGKISAHYLTTETAATPESLQQLISPLRSLSL